MRSLISRVAVLAAATTTTTSSWAQSTSPSPTTPAQTIVASTIKRAKVPFGAGERMEYDVKFGSIRGWKRAHGGRRTR